MTTNEQPVWLTSALKAGTLTVVGGIVAFAAKQGIEIDAGTVAGITAALVGAELIGARWVWSKVTSMAKLERVLPPEQHAAVMGALKVKP